MGLYVVIITTCHHNDVADDNKSVSIDPDRFGATILNSFTDYLWISLQKNGLMRWKETLVQHGFMSQFQRSYRSEPRRRVH